MFFSDVNRLLDLLHQLRPLCAESEDDTVMILNCSLCITCKWKALELSASMHPAKLFQLEQRLKT